MNGFGNYQEKYNVHVVKAMENLLEAVHRTPLQQSTTLNDYTNKDVFMKMENLQRTGSFKLRGAYNKVASLTDIEAARGIVAASAGNHAQGVALSARERGIKAKIYMPVHTPTSKIDATQSYGAEVVLEGESYNEAFSGADRERVEKGATFVHAFDDPEVMAGQGTVALEMMQQCPDLDTILVPVGGGGLLAGMAMAIKSFFPHVKIIGVQASEASATWNRFKGTGPLVLQSVKSIADGISVKEAGNLTFPIIEELVDDMLTVSEEEIAAAIVFMLERHKTLVEGAGAASVAAVLCKSNRLEGKRIGVVVSGGNADLAKISLYKQLSQRAKTIRRIS
ncbi:threonine ammonia-lyase [Guptibacillus hwajinpoensis]|uniref:threonine ammonia-lyase n=1 Tax=Guptibacillus hwajinpoensis TaxID=208199 RepID=UPI001CFD4CA7|nr:threonine ammonia-lyase [Pseudalkalibacillus hwajinpoensis]WLR61101.1 threonine ammonia-lyase [Pseudalkalibacillus hwajinpoensis]